MAASGLMSIGIRTMTANYAALQTTGHNIANANVDGYSRQQAEFVTSSGQFTGAGFFGKGVSVETVTRSYNAFLTREAASAKAAAAADSTRLEQLRQLELVFKTGEQGLGYAASQLFNALSDLGNQPADGATRQVVLARAEELVNRINNAGRTFDALQRGVDTELMASVASINDLAQRLAQVNDRLSYSAGLGQPANDLLDERDRLLSKLSEQVQISTVEAPDNSVAVYVGGQRLVLGSKAETLQLLRDPAVSTRMAVGFSSGGVPRPIDAQTLGSGKVAGLLRFQNEDLAEARNLVGRLAVAVSGALNAQQSVGVSLRVPYDPTQTPPPFFSVPDGKVYGNQTNQLDGSGNPVGLVSIRSISNPAEVRATDYELRMDPARGPGAFVLTPLSGTDRRPIEGVSGQPVPGTGLIVDVGDGLGGGIPAVTDRFVLQPVAGVASGMKLVLRNTADIAAASPLTATVQPAAGSVLALGGVRMLSQVRLTPPDPTSVPADQSGIRIEFGAEVGGSRAFTWQRLDANGNVLSADGGLWAPGTPLRVPVDANGDPIPAGDPRLATDGFTVDLAGSPSLGDVVKLTGAVPAFLASNNGNALALASLRDALVAEGLTVTDAYAAALGNIGVRVQGAQSSADITQAMATQAEAARSSVSGVNLDEEAARLIQFQQSYQAAAKVLQVAQSLFQTLIDAAAGR
jgi:flagellar hook-associated protein 1 FlgK